MVQSASLAPGVGLAPDSATCGLVANSGSDNVSVIMVTIVLKKQRIYLWGMSLQP